jgi:hypothetical protein
VSIESFEPLTIAFPDLDKLTDEGKIPAGDLEFALPEHHIQLVDLSMGGIIPDKPHIGGDAKVFSYTTKTDQDVSFGEFMCMLIEMRGTMEEMHGEMQKILDERGAVL